MKQQYSGANTSVNTKRIPRLFTTVTTKLDGWEPHTINMDLGCGKDPTNVNEYLHALGVYNAPWDPYWNISQDCRLLNTFGANTATISNVLNVIKEKEARLDILRKAVHYASGVTYIAVYEGDKSGKGKKTKEDCWQENRRTVDYVKEVEEVFTTVVYVSNLIYAFGEKR